jgi:hypothetical protein
MHETVSKKSIIWVCVSEQRETEKYRAVPKAIWAVFPDISAGKWIAWVF